MWEGQEEVSLDPAFVIYVYVRDVAEKPLKLAGFWPDPKTAAIAAREILLTARAEGFLYPRDFDPSVGYRIVPFHAIDEACIEEETMPTLSVADKIKSSMAKAVSR